MPRSNGKYHREGGDVLSSRVASQGLMDIGERIRKRRQELHWSQEEFAEEADISVNTVIRIEGGQCALRHICREAMENITGKGGMY